MRLFPFQDWFCAVEVTHFAKGLHKGHPHFSEMLYCDPRTVLIQDPRWSLLRDLVDPTTVLGLRGFCERSCGQAIGTIARKSKSGKIKPKDSVTFQDFCRSFRYGNLLFAFMLTFSAILGLIDMFLPFKTEWYFSAILKILFCHFKTKWYFSAI